MEQKHRRIVVGVDGSPDSRIALEHALRDAARRDAAVEVVTAYAPPEYWLPLYGPPALTPDVIRERIREATAEVVAQVTASLEGSIAPMPPITITVVLDGAASALLDAAKGADLLVVGSRGHGAVSSLLLGSVGLHCAVHAPCPVTVVRPTVTAKVTEPAAAEPAPATT